MLAKRSITLNSNGPYSSSGAQRYVDAAVCKYSVSFVTLVVLAGLAIRSELRGAQSSKHLTDLIRHGLISVPKFKSKPSSKRGEGRKRVTRGKERQSTRLPSDCEWRWASHGDRLAAMLSDEGRFHEPIRTYRRERRIKRKTIHFERPLNMQRTTIGGIAFTRVLILVTTASVFLLGAQHDPKQQSESNRFADA
jgi:hypothetical protein